jgi:WD40 repeat protein
MREGRDGSRNKGWDEWRVSVRAAAFSPNGKCLLTAYEFDGHPEQHFHFTKELSLWDVATGKECWSLQAGEVNAIAFAFMPDGKQILIGGDDGLKVLDVSNGKVVRSFEQDDNRVEHLAVSPDGKLALCAGGIKDRNHESGDLKLWDVASGKPIQILQMGVFRYLMFSGDGKLMLADTWVWDVAKRDLLTVLKGSEGWGRPDALSPDGKLGAAGKRLEPIRQGALVLWETTTGKAMRTLHEDFPSAIAFTADGKGLLAGNPIKHRMALWDVATGKEVWTAKISEADTVFAFSPDSKLAFTAPGTRTAIAIWDTVAGKELRGWGLTARGPSFGLSSVTR